MKSYSKILFALSLIIAFAIIAVPQSANAALEQPPGQFPITEPLRPIEPGNKPNYSGNIQDGESVNLSETEQDTPAGNSNNSSVSVDSDLNTVLGIKQETRPVEQSNRKYWIVGIIFIAVVTGTAWFFRKKKLDNSAKNLAVTALIFSGTVLGLLYQPVIAQAQGTSQRAPQNLGQNSNQTIQRTIIPEDQVNEDPLAASQKTHKSLYAILTVALILTAGIAWYSLARNKPSKPAL